MGWDFVRRGGVGIYGEAHESSGMIEKKNGVDELFSLKGSNVITPFFDNFTRASIFFFGLFQFRSTLGFRSEIRQGLGKVFCGYPFL